MDKYLKKYIKYKNKYLNLLRQQEVKIHKTIKNNQKQ
jgi:hypothetical protein